MLTSTLVSKVLAEGGFDVERATALGWLDDKQKEAVGRSQFRRAVVELAAAVAGQDTYALPETVVVVEELKVGGTVFVRAGTRDVWDLLQGTRRLVGPGGVFAPSFDDVGNAQIQLYPTPEAAAAITGLVALSAPDLLDDGVSSPILPEDMHLSLMSGAVSVGLMLIDEDVQGAQVHAQRFEVMVGELEQRGNERIGSGEPVQIQVAGYHW